MEALSTVFIASVMHWMKGLVWPHLKSSVLKNETSQIIETRKRELTFRSYTGNNATWNVLQPV